ncbi:hypothetical protein ARSEF4850_000518 [Beauveria asiatica]
MAAERPDKKEKKEKKEKRASEESGVKKDKKDKKEKKDKKDKLAAAVEDKIQQDAATKPSKKEKKKAAVAADDNSDSDMEDGAKAAGLPLERTVVPFAIPVADDKGMKKVYKTIRKSAKNNTLKRGVKEVVKTLRKSPVGGPSSTAFPGIVVIAGDISPADVISHIPVLCEDHNVPFIFVISRAELGAAAKTKRPTSVVMIMEKQDGKKKKSSGKKGGEEDGAAAAAEDGEDFGEAYASLAKYVQKEYQKQSFWAKGDSQA